MGARLLVDLVLLVSQWRMSQELLHNIKLAADLAAALDLLVRQLLGLREFAEVDEVALLAHDVHVLGHAL